MQSLTLGLSKSSTAWTNLAHPHLTVLENPTQRSPPINPGFTAAWAGSVCPAWLHLRASHFSWAFFEKPDFINFADIPLVLGVSWVMQ